MRHLDGFSGSAMPDNSPGMYFARIGLCADPCEPMMQKNTHKIVIVGGGAGGLDLATRLGKAFGRGTQAHITLVDKNRTHIWKPKLHEIASGSMDFGDHEVGYMAQAHWNHFTFRIG